MVSGGIIAIVTGRILTLCVERRRFYRRNAMGIEEFKNFAAVVITRAVERIVVLLGRVLVFGGIGWLCISWTPAGSSWMRFAMEHFRPTSPSAAPKAPSFVEAPMADQRQCSTVLDDGATGQR